MPSTKKNRGRKATRGRNLNRRRNTNNNNRKPNRKSKRGRRKSKRGGAAVDTGTYTKNELDFTQPFTTILVSKDFKTEEITKIFDVINKKLGGLSYKYYKDFNTNGKYYTRLSKDFNTKGEYSTRLSEVSYTLKKGASDFYLTKNTEDEDFDGTKDFIVGTSNRSTSSLTNETPLEELKTLSPLGFIYLIYKGVFTKDEIRRFTNPPDNGGKQVFCPGVVGFCNPPSDVEEQIDGFNNFFENFYDKIDPTSIKEFCTAIETDA